MEDRDTPTFDEDHRCLAGRLPVPEGPVTQFTSEPIKTFSPVHRHLSRKNGLSKLCQSRMALSGNEISLLGTSAL
jgi:PAS domain-containing serine/threonine kinase